MFRTLKEDLTDALFMITVGLCALTSKLENEARGLFLRLKGDRPRSPKERPVYQQEKDGWYKSSWGTWEKSVGKYEAYIEEPDKGEKGYYWCVDFPDGSCKEGISHELGSAKKRADEELAEK